MKECCFRNLDWYPPLEKIGEITVTVRKGGRPRSRFVRGGKQDVRERRMLVRIIRDMLPVLHAICRASVANAR